MNHQEEMGPLGKSTAAFFADEASFGGVIQFKKSGPREWSQIINPGYFPQWRQFRNGRSYWVIARNVGGTRESDVHKTAFPYHRFKSSYDARLFLFKKGYLTRRPVKRP